MTKNKTLYINILWTILYAVVTLLFVMRHEIWADEAQVWLLVKQLSLPGLFKHLVNEGHPSLFYLLVMPFAKLGFSIFSMQIICWLSSCVSVFLFLQFSPFGRFTKFAVLISAGFLYFFPVIARSYSLIPLLVFASAILYKKVQENPQKYSLQYAVVLAMLANTHVIMFAFVFVLGCYFVEDYLIKNKSSVLYFAAGIIFFGLFAVIIQLFGTCSSNQAINLNFDDVPFESIKTILIFFLNSIGLVYKSEFIGIQLTTYTKIASLTMLVLFVILNVQLFVNNKKMAYLSWLAIGFQLGIYIFSYKAMMYQTRIFSAYIILLFCYWITLSEDNLKKSWKIFSKMAVNITLSVFFLLTVGCGVQSAALDIFYNYSSAAEVADFLQKHTEKDAVIIPNAVPFGLAVYAKAPDKYFYDFNTGRKIKYMIWKKLNIFNDESFIYVVEKAIKEKHFEHTYLLVSSFLELNCLEKMKSSNFELIFVTSPSIAVGEAFKVYKYTGPAK